MKHATFDGPNEVLQLVRSHIEMGEDREFHLRGAVYEIMQNVEDHAGSAIGAVSCARYIEQKHKVRVAIVDRGDGVYSTLRRKHEDTISAAMALSRVIKGGYSAKSRQSNMGLGVSNLWAFTAQHMRGQVCIVSEDCIAYNKLGSHAPQFENLGYRFPGTGVFFNVPVTGK